MYIQADIEGEHPPSKPQAEHLAMAHCIAAFKGTLGIGLCSVLHPRQHSIGYMGDGF